MTIGIAILAGLMGFAAGWIAARLTRGGGEAPPADEAGIQPADTRILKQYLNFLEYNGTGKGQINLEEQD